VPDGLLQWYDDHMGEGRVVRGGREYPVRAADMDPPWPHRRSHHGPGPGGPSTLVAPTLLLVEDGGRLVGVVSARDLLGVCASADMRSE
jgi:CBS domain-containing protein